MFIAEFSILSSKTALEAILRRVRNVATRNTRLESEEIPVHDFLQSCSTKLNLVSYSILIECDYSGISEKYFRILVLAPQEPDDGDFQDVR